MRKIVRATDFTQNLKTEKFRFGPLTFKTPLSILTDPSKCFLCKMERHDRSINIKEIQTLDLLALRVVHLLPKVKVYFAGKNKTLSHALTDKTKETKKHHMLKTWQIRSMAETNIY